jgi:hypothetical protein
MEGKFNHYQKQREEDDMGSPMYEVTVSQCFFCEKDSVCLAIIEMVPGSAGIIRLVCEDHRK